MNHVLLILHFVGLILGTSVSVGSIVMAGLIGRATPEERPVLGRFMPSVFPPIKADTIVQLANALELSPTILRETVDSFNRAVVPGTFNHQVLDDCHTTGELTPPGMMAWARAKADSERVVFMEERTTL